PRRQELLRKVNIPFTLRKQHVDEQQVSISDPAEKVKQLAILKGQNTPIKHKDEVVLTADTVVSFNRQIFEKPADKEEARKMISALSGNVHDVFTGVMIRSLTEETVFVERTKVEFWPLSDAEIDWYISTDEPYDKAGAYGIQNLGA